MPPELQLPPEIMAQIVQYYNACERVNDNPHAYIHKEDEETLIALCRVSRAWKDVAQPRLWRWVGKLGQRRVEGILTALAVNPRLGRLVESVQLRLTSTTFQAIVDCCPNLKDFAVIHGTTLRSENVTELADKCAGLEELALGFCPEITEEGWISTARLLQLRKLVLWDAPGFGDRAACAVVDACRQLTKLHLIPADISCATVSYILVHAPKLVHLEIQGHDRLRRREIEDRSRRACTWVSSLVLAADIPFASAPQLFNYASELESSDY
ncbi:hypothetical protein DFS34DRAFT_605484 [Phlyctochytrium arcticum]|nr:hypothetical protein DFS34DRAFT_605484 [Phlyctochytrium arcticum]